MKRHWVYLGMIWLFLPLCGCTKMEKMEEASEIEFVIVEEDEIPETMKKIIESEKEEAFQITYEDGEYLYIGQGYGKKEIEGYEISVDICKESEHFIYVHTILTGPREEPAEKEASWPYVVIRAEGKKKQVIFLNE